MASAPPQTSAASTLTLDTSLEAAVVKDAFERLLQGEPSQSVLRGAPCNAQGLLALISRVDAYRSAVKHQPFGLKFRCAASGGVSNVEFHATSKRPALASADAGLNVAERKPAVATPKKALPSLQSGAYLDSLREACGLLGLPEDVIDGTSAADAVLRARAATSWADEHVAAEAARSDEMLPETPAREGVRATAKRERSEDEADPFRSPEGRDCPMSADRTQKQSFRMRRSLDASSSR
jgi:hypothetical protein